MNDLQQSMDQGFYFDCVTPRDAAIKNLVFRESKLECNEVEHTSISGIKSARFIVDEETFNDFPIFEEEFKTNLKDWEVQIAGDIKNRYSWVGTAPKSNPPPNSL